MDYKIIVKITDGKIIYEEDVTEDQKESFKECSTNGANPWLKDFNKYTRELEEHELTTEWRNQFNNADEDSHFIYGWVECFMQSSNCPQSFYSSGIKLKISVKHI